MSDTPTIDLIAGARPNFMKVAPILAALRRHRDQGGGLGWRLVHTGQHSGPAMSDSFFEQLAIPKPDIHLEAGGGSPAAQTGAIMLGYETLIARAPPALTLVVGDVTSTFACAMTARRADVPVAHVEAGIRSGDGSMPEEHNRRATDAVSNWFFTTSTTAGANLRREGVDRDRIFFVGNTMIDTLRANMARLRPPAFWQTLALAPRQYLVLTLHRPANVDDPQRLVPLLRSVAKAARELPVVFPVHPRTAARLAGSALPRGLNPVSPQPYLEFLHLVRHARGVVTDSGGLSEEATALRVPCITVRENTERPETVLLGTNELVGQDPARLEDALVRVLSGEWKKGRLPPRWDGRAGERIVAELARILRPGGRA